jgi:hypothetical protein
VDLGFGGEQSVRVLAAKFETSDSFERVKAFYKEHLGSEVTKFTDQGSEGKTTMAASRPDRDRNDQCFDVDSIPNDTSTHICELHKKIRTV